MSVLLLAVGLCLLLAPGLVARAPTRLAPRDWTRILASCLVVGSVAVELALVLLTAPTLLRHLGVPALALACERMLRSLAPGGPLVGWAAAVLGAAVPARAVSGIRRTLAARQVCRVEPGVGDHHDRGWYELVVLPAAEPFAVAVTGAPDQVAVTTGLLSTLPADEVALVVAHEEAHLRHCHDRVLTALAGIESAFGILPRVGRSASLVRLGLERWADEAAAGRDPADRRALQHALVRLASEAPFGAAGVAAFGGPSGVAERIASLDRPAPQASLMRRSIAWSPTAGMGGMAALATFVWVGQAHAMLVMAGMCRA